MSQANTLETLNGMFKNTYADKIKNLIPDGVKLLNMIKFMEKSKQPGNTYNQPITVGLEHGITFGSADSDVMDLMPAVSGVMQNATIRGNPVLLRSQIGYTTLSRAAQGGQAAFEDAMKYVVANMLRSLAKKLEIEMLYGQMGYAMVSSVAGAVLTIKTSEWAPGIWAGAEKLPIEIRSADGSTSRGTAKVKAVDMILRTVTLETAVPGIVTTGGSEDVIWHAGAYGNEFPGIHKILTQSSGSLFNISVSDYVLFRGNQYAAGGSALSFSKLNNAAALAVEKGFEGRMLAMINPRAWANLNSNEAALRKYDDSYSAKKLENGTEALVYHSQNGEIEVMASLYVKEGYAYLLAQDEWKRVGSADMTFKIPGQDEQYLRLLENSTAVEIRLWSDQALFTDAPGKNVVITGIVNTL